MNPSDLREEIPASPKLRHSGGINPSSLEKSQGSQKAGECDAKAESLCQAKE
jgi:hypothetical protein